MPDLVKLPPRPETAHLRTIARHQAPRDIVAYALWLYQQGYYRVALIFLSLCPGIPIEGLELQARTHRKLGEFHEADLAWDKVDVRGYQFKDAEWQLRAAQGKGLVSVSRGTPSDLQWALTRFSYVIEESGDFPQLQAKALLDRGTVLDAQGKPIDAALDYYRAYQQMTPCDARWSALTSLGIAMKAAGHWAGADLAFKAVEQGCLDWTLVTNARIERLDLASLQGDSVLATALRMTLDSLTYRMGPSMLVDYEHTLGHIASRRNSYKVAINHWKIAAQVAAEFELKGWMERIKHLLLVRPPTPIQRQDERLAPVYAGLRAA